MYCTAACPYCQAARAPAGAQGRHRRREGARRPRARAPRGDDAAHAAGAPCRRSGSASAMSAAATSCTRSSARAGWTASSRPKGPDRHGRTSSSPASRSRRSTSRTSRSRSRTRRRCSSRRRARSSRSRCATRPRSSPTGCTRSRSPSTVTAKAGEQDPVPRRGGAGRASSRCAACRRQDLEPLLGIACPTILYPYVRETISDLVTRGGFPPVLLAPVSFEALYAQRLQQQAAAGPRIELAS